MFFAPAVEKGLFLPRKNRYWIDEWFPNFFWSRTICGTRTVIAHHLVPGKRILPKIICSKVCPTRLNTNSAWKEWLWEIIMIPYKTNRGSTQKCRNLLPGPDQ